MKQFKHLLTAVLSFFICISVVFPQTISGEETDIKTPLDYSLYSESDNIAIFSSVTDITGNIYSGKDFTFWGAQYIQNGNIEVKENYTSSDSSMFHTKAGEINKDWDKNFDQYLFAKASPYTTYEETKTFDEEPIDISNSIYGLKDLIIKGTKFTGKGYIIADGDITYDVSSFAHLNKDDAIVIYSRNGNININSSNASMNAVLYAPNGTVKVNGSDFTLNGRIYANKIDINGATIRIVSSDKDLELLPLGIEKTYTVKNDFDEGNYQNIEVKEDTLQLKEKEDLTFENIEKIYKEENETGITVKQTKPSYLPKEDFNISFHLEGYGSEIAEDRPVDVVLLIDDSGSMRGAPMREAKEAAKLVVSQMRENDRISVIGIAYTSLYHKMSNDKESLYNAINSMSAYGGTDIASGIYYSLKQFDDSTREKYIFILSDGISSGVIPAAEYAYQQGVHIYTIAFGSKTYLMPQIAYAGQGIYKFAPKPEDLTKIMDSFAATVFSNAGRNVSFQTTVIKKDYLDESKLDENCIKKENEDGSFTLTWNFDNIEINDIKEITIPVKVNGNESYKEILRDTSCLYYGKDGAPHILYGEDVTLYTSEYEEKGSWTTVFDSKVKDTQWSYVVWNGQRYGNNTTVKVSVSEDGETFSEPLIVENRQELENITGRFIKLEVEMETSMDGRTPVIEDISIYSKDVEITQTENAEPEVELSYKPDAVVNRPYTITMHINDDESLNKLSYKITSDESVMISNEDTQTPAVIFKELGAHILNVEVSDGEYTVTEQISVNVEKDKVYENIDPEDKNQELKISADIPSSLNPDTVYKTKIIQESGNPIAWYGAGFISGNYYEPDEQGNLVYRTPRLFNVNKELEIFACDWYGNCTKEIYPVTINSNEPQIEILTDKDIIKDDETGMFTVNFIEKEKMKDIHITLNGKEVTLNENNQYILKGLSKGSYELKVSATVIADNTVIEKSKTITVEETDVTAPELDIRFNKEVFYQGDEVQLNIIATDTQNDITLKVTLDDVEQELSDHTFSFIADEVREYVVVVEAKDSAGNITRIMYMIPVNEKTEETDKENPVMEVTFTPDKFTVGEEIIMHVDASDNSGKVNISATLDGKALVFENNNNTTLLFNEEKEYILIVRSEDESGNYVENTYTITPQKSETETDTNGPEIRISIDKTKVVKGESVTAEISAYDVSDVSLLKAYLNDIEIDIVSGKVTFTVDKIGINVLKIFGIDTLGNENELLIDIECVEDYGEEDYPLITYNINNNQKDVYLNEEIDIEIGASDADGIKDLTVSVNDEEILLDEHGKGKYTPDTIGELIFTITATDTRGNQSVLDVTHNVIERNDKEAPAVSITNLKDGDTISNPTDIIGNVTNENGNEGFYRLEIAPDGSEDYTLIAEGNKEKNNEVLGKLDTTLFNNGTYEIRLSGIGSTQINEVFVRVNIESKIKPGEFSIAYKDMEMPVVNLPIIFTRSYSTLRRDEVNESGYGWKLGVEQVKIEENHIPGEYWNVKNMGTMMPSFQLVETKEHTVSIDWGNGNIEKFRMVPDYNPSLNAEIFDIHMKYEAISGNGSKLEVYKDENLLCNSGKLLNSKLDVFNPNTYKITDVNGLVYIVSETEGVKEIIDKNGNKITFSKDGITGLNQSIHYIRDTQNRITRITSNLGEVHYKYDKNGDLIEVKDLNGYTTKYVYDENHYLSEIIDPRGIRVQRNEYDENGRLIAVVDADGNRISYEHDIEGRQEIITDREGNVTQYIYDDYGNVTLITDALGNTVKYSYDENHHMSSVEDVYGNKTLYEYDKTGKLISVTNPEGFTSSNTYNEEGKVTAISSMDVIQLVLDYDDKGRLTDTTDIAGNKTSYEYDERGQITSISDSIGVYMKFTYNDKGQVISSTDGENNKVSYTYDEKGRCLTKTVYRAYDSQNSNGTENLTETYSYNNAGQIKKIIYPDESYITVEYNEIYKVSATTDEIGRRTEYKYDMFGNLSEVRYCDGTIETFRYDKNGRNTEAIDRLGKKVIMEYDKVGNLISKTYGNNTKETFTYDRKYRLIESKDVNNHKTVYAYNKLDKNTSITDCLGNTVTFTYNNQGLLTSMTDAKNNTYTYEYDKAGNHIKTIFPDNTSVESTYDKRTRLTEQKDAYGNITKYAYDNNDRLISVTDANNSTWKYSYSSTGELISVKDPKGNTTEYKYDKAGRVSEITTPLGNKATFTYDCIGNIKTYTDFKGNTTTYTYDKNGRLTQTENDEVITYTYSTNGLLTSVKDSHGKTTYDYDLYYGLKKKILPDGNTLEYSYDTAGNITAVKTKYGTTGYEYDDLYRLVKVIDKNNLETTYSYDKNGNKTETLYPNGIRITYEYDNCNRLINEKVYKNDEVIEYYKYTLGKNGERLRIEESNQIKTYTYDKLNRLTSESVFRPEDNVVVSNTTYTYDELSNRLTKTEDNVTTTYTYNSLNQLLSETTGEEVITYTYDLNGNLIKKKGLETTDYVYNQSNQLIKATVQKGNDVTVESYEVDYEGNRISKTTNEIKKHYLVDTNTTYPMVLAQYNDSKEVEIYYTIGDERISLESKDGKRYYVYDGHGSTRLLSDENGVISDTYDYDAYGIVISRTGNTENEFLYAGEVFDETTGLYYLRARYMNPETGTFISMDPYSGTLNDPVSLHKYLYANANPITYVDPTGYFSLADMSASTAIQAILNKAQNGVTLKMGLNILDGLCTVYDVMKQIDAGENLADIADAMVRGGIVSVFLNSMCRIKTFGVILSAVLLGHGLKSQVDSIKEAWDNGDWDLVFTRTIQLAISVDSLKQSCFTEETLIETENGYKEIKDIEVGDKVLSYNVETGDCGLKEVVQTFEHEVNELVHVYTEDEVINTTENHPFYVERYDENLNRRLYSWISASELKENDILYTSTDKLVRVTKVEVEKLDKPVKVYNFEVKDYHTYYVGEEHVLVHNDCNVDNNQDNGFVNWRDKGEKDTVVYFVYDDNDNIVYVGITKQDPEIRRQQHNMIKEGRYVTLEPQTEKLTRNQARALEQYYIGYGNPKGKKRFVDNIINSIGPNNKYLEQSKDWAVQYIIEHGLKLYDN